ncbi:MAG: dienelactone hydrolase family protein [Polyangiales bacterium]
MSVRTGDLATYERERFEYEGAAHDLYRKGRGPAVIIMAELPGISPELLGFADRVAERGCTVVVPHLFGPPLADVTGSSRAGRALVVARTVSEVCISREFSLFASGRASPITSWLRGLARHEHARCGGPGVGIVGMCFTGGFALALAAEPSVLAPVVSQPSLPFNNPRGIDCDKLTLATIRQRCAKEGLEVLGLRFKRDQASPYPRFQYLRDKLGDGFVAVEIEPRFGNPKGPFSFRHSVLTLDLVDEPGNPTREAMERVLDLFERKLLA